MKKINKDKAAKMLTNTRTVNGGMVVIKHRNAEWSMLWKWEKLSFTHVKFSRSSVDVTEASLNGDWINSELCLFQHFVDSWLRAIQVLKVEIRRPDIHAFLLLAARYKHQSMAIVSQTRDETGSQFVTLPKSLSLSDPTESSNILKIKYLARITKLCLVV